MSATQTMPEEAPVVTQVTAAVVTATRKTRRALVKGTRDGWNSLKNLVHLVTLALAGAVVVSTVLSLVGSALYYGASALVLVPGPVLAVVLAGIILVSTYRVFGDHKLALIWR